jgi:PRP8 domain IV core
VHVAQAQRPRGSAQTASRVQMCMFNLYDDWVSSVSVYTAFSRLILILRSLHVNGEKARMLLRPDRSVVVQPHHMWPTLSDEQWIKVEVRLRTTVPESAPWHACGRAARFCLRAFSACGSQCCSR